VTVGKYGVALTLLLLLFCSPARDAGSEEALPAQGQVLATYDVALAGFSLGEFQLIARFQGPSYKMRGEGRFSLFLGRFHKSSGKVTSAGRLRQLGPEPASFVVSYEGDGKEEERRISFDDGDVSDVTIIPRKRPSTRRVPVTKEQLVDVIDPLSAAFLHTQAGNSVCNDTLPVFDGRLRFDLVLTPKRVESLPAKAPKGLSGSVAVCEVKFVPVGGHKPDNGVIKYLSTTNRIEAWLVRMPKTDLYVPYWIGLPTVLGSASVTLTRIEMK
jgi:hypothetical protein